ncbi:ROK family protein [Streptomyces sp. URMC 128]|uniref:ROK family protein n=1 Tax=Streptomyces sp. URMC 128 TaxID=3423404 RepID=UPI003F1E1036
MAYLDSRSDQTMSESETRKAARKINGSSAFPARISTLDQLLGELEAAPAPWTEGDRRALVRVLVDASLDGDEDSLRSAVDWLQWVYATSDELAADLRRSHQAEVAALISVAQYGLRRAQAIAAASSVDLRGSQGAFLRAVGRDPGCSNLDLVELLGVGETQVSRTGGQLAKLGLVTKRKIGRRNYWDMTPRGWEVLRSADGSEGAAEKSPIPANEPAEVDRVVASTLELEQLSRTPTAAAVAERANLSEGAAGRATSSLVSHGLISRDATQPEVLHINDEQVSVIGVSVRPDSIAGVVTDVRTKIILPLRQKRLPGQSPDSVVSEIAGLVQELKADISDTGSRNRIIGIGVELAGQVDTVKGEVIFSPDLQEREGAYWRGVPLAADLAQHTDLPTVIENDANALAAHAQWFGDGAGVEDLVVILIGDRGVGSGVVSGRQLLHGARGVSGEIGHMAVSGLRRKCRCGNYGCLETVASVAGIRKSFGLDSPPFDLAPIARAVDRGDSSAVDAIRMAGEALGRGLSFVLNIVRPGLVVVYGPQELTQPDLGVQSASVFLREMEGVAKSGSFPRDTLSPKIALYPVDSSLGARGAAAAVLQHLITQPNRVRLAEMALRAD